MTNFARIILVPLICGICATERPLPDILGVTHVAGRYYLTDKDFLNEGADQILALGSRVIKVWFCGKRHPRFRGDRLAPAEAGGPASVYPYNSNWPEIKTLVEAAQTPYYRQLFSKPFTTYILVVTALGRPDDYWRTGITEQQKQDEQKQFYELAKYFLTAYKGTGKTFVLQHWEGDWMIRGSVDPKTEPAPLAIKSMIEWLNARQAGVNQARVEIVEPGIRVYHATEVNRVVDSMKTGVANMVNRVLPHTNLDLVSYSAWDAAVEHSENPQVLRSALDFIAGNMPDSPDACFRRHEFTPAKAGGDRNVYPPDVRRVYIGEFGMPENLYPAERIQRAIPNVVKTGLDWGCPYIVYWQLYCNELKDPQAKPPVKSNDAMRGFWLIRPDGSKAWTWDYFYRLFIRQT